MKKLLSILLAVLVIVTSCVCAISVSAVDCSNGHNVVTYTSQNNTYHVGRCTACNKTVKRSHNMVYDSRVEPTCTTAGKINNKCEDCGYTESSIITSGHSFTRTEYTFFFDSDNNAMCNKVDYCSKTCEIVTGPFMAGATNVCPECRNSTVTKKTVYYPSCTSIGKTVYSCSFCNTDITKDKLPMSTHTYETKIVEPETCEEAGSIKKQCVNCGFVAEENKLLEKKHRMDKAGEIYEYNYSGLDCEVKGICADCNTVVKVTKKYVVTEKCSKCESDITSKTVVLPNNCEDPATVTYKCANINCSGYTETTVPLGHAAKKTTYYYQDGIFDYAQVDCYRCGVKVINDDSYKNKTACRYCSGKIIERVVVEPTCNANGYTKVTCGDCSKSYTEDSVVKKSHSVTEAKWVYDYEANLSRYSLSCANYGCIGDAYANNIAVLGVCPECLGNKQLIDKREIYSDCITKGYTVFKCKTCSHRITDEGIVYYDQEKANTNAKSHNNLTQVTDATCKAEGYTKTTCKNCYHTVISNRVAKKNHNSDWIISNYNAVNGTVTTTYTGCDLCGETPDATTVIGNLGICKANGCTQLVVRKEIQNVSCAKELEGHTKYTCNVGHEIVENIVPFAHQYGPWIIEKKATCISEGLKVKTCSVCEGRFETVIPINTNSAGEPVHSLVVFVEGKAPTCTEDGYSAETYCVWCGETFDSKVMLATGHKTNPLSENPHYCTACNNYIVDEYGEGMSKVPMTDANGNPMYIIKDYEVEINPENGEPVYEKDANGDYLLDEYGKKIPVYKKDKYGNRIPIYELDENGNKKPIYKLVPCKCIHHNNAPLGQVFFKIILFFCQIFGINKTCDCGEAHY